MSLDFRLALCSWACGCRWAVAGWTEARLVLGRGNVTRRILARSRYLVVVAVLGTFVSAATAILYGAIAVGGIVVETITQSDFRAEGSKHLAVELIEMIDLFLLGIVLYIVALGLYQLFIDADLATPAWLAIRTLDDLKERRVSVVVAVLSAVTFLSYVVNWQVIPACWRWAPRSGWSCWH